MYRPSKIAVQATQAVQRIGQYTVTAARNQLADQRFKIVRRQENAQPVETEKAVL